MRQNTPGIPGKAGLRFLGTIALAAAAFSAPPASAQTTPVVPQAVTANLVTKAELQATGTQLGHKIDAQTGQIDSLRQQLLALKTQLEALDRQVIGMKVPAAPVRSQVRTGR